MQIILTQEECEIIYDALETDFKEYLQDADSMEKRVIKVSYIYKRITDIKNIMKRFEPYLKEEQ